MQCKCLCVALREVYHCVFIHRCIHLKELVVYLSLYVTDAGFCMVISQRNQLRVLELWGLPCITGTCAVCDDPENSVFYNCAVYDSVTAGLSLITKANTGPYCELV